MELEHLQREALKLQPAERAELAYQLLLSFEAAPQQDQDQALIEEVKRRTRQIDRGEITLIPGDQVLKKAQALLR